MFRFEVSSASRWRNGFCPARIRFSASSSENHSHLSTSGNSFMRPERGGHSIENILLFRREESQSPSSPHAVTTLPPACFTSPSARKPPSGVRPVSSSNSRRAASRESSSESYSPLGMDHAARSFFAQNGPPGCASKTSRRFLRRRYSNKPALRFGIEDGG